MESSTQDRDFVAAQLRTLRGRDLRNGRQRMGSEQVVAERVHGCEVRRRGGGTGGKHLRELGLESGCIQSVVETIRTRRSALVRRSRRSGEPVSKGQGFRGNAQRRIRGEEGRVLHVGG